MYTKREADSCLEKLGDFTATPRVLWIAFLAVGIGPVSATADALPARLGAAHMPDAEHRQECLCHVRAKPGAVIAAISR